MGVFADRAHAKREDQAVQLAKKQAQEAAIQVLTEAAQSFLARCNAYLQAETAAAKEVGLHATYSLTPAEHEVAVLFVLDYKPRNLVQGYAVWVHLDEQRAVRVSVRRNVGVGYENVLDCGKFDHEDGKVWLAIDEALAKMVDIADQPRR